MKHGFEGTREIWDLKGVRIALDDHQIHVRGQRLGSRSFSVHDIGGIQIEGRRVTLSTLDGRLVDLGTARADKSTLRQARVAIQQAIELRRRGSLEDKHAMEIELQAARPRQTVSS